MDQSPKATCIRSASTCVLCGAALDAGELCRSPLCELVVVVARWLVSHPYSDAEIHRNGDVVTWARTIRDRTTLGQRDGKSSN